ncbi:MAG: hypothetical protein V1800_00705 [Candidatus Latescibacterota bacterium]
MSPCTPYEQICAFTERLLSEKEQHTMGTHVTECAPCRRTLDQVAEVIEVIENDLDEHPIQTPRQLLDTTVAMIPASGREGQPTPEPWSAMDGLRKIVARWVPPVSPRLALARSVSVARPTNPTLYEAEDRQIALGIKRQQNGRWAILGTLLPEAPSGEVRLSPQDAPGDRAVSTAPDQRTSLDRTGFGFFEVARGAYVLHILFEQQVIEIGKVIAG